MESFTPVWNMLLVWPIEAALVQLTALTASAGLAIILFTVVVRTLLLPLSFQQVRSQKAMMRLQPQLKELQRRYSKERQRFAQEQMRLYKESGVNPFVGCLPMLLQMPIWIALYSALINLSNNVESFQTPFLWIPNLAAPSMPNPEAPSTWPLVIFPLLTAATQWVVQKMSMMPSADPQQQQMNRMMEFMPLMFLFFAFSVGAGLTLYWVVSNVYTIVQQRLMVGWGTLPFLGSTEASSSTTSILPVSADTPRNPPPRSSRRRRRGK